MGFKDSCQTMKNCMDMIAQDLQKAEEGNKAAAQRVRINTIKFEKAAKMYRKESIRAHKGGGAGGSVRKSKAKKTAATRAAKTPARSNAAAKKPAKRAVKPKTMTRKRATAKLPKKRTQKRR